MTSIRLIWQSTGIRRFLWLISLPFFLFTSDPSYSSWVRVLVGWVRGIIIILRFLAVFIAARYGINNWTMMIVKVSEGQKYYSARRASFPAVGVGRGDWDWNELRHLSELIKHHRAEEAILFYETSYKSLPRGWIKSRARDKYVILKIQRMNSWNRRS